MKKKAFLLIPFTALVLSGCDYGETNKNIISQRWIHKYGYDVPKDEWETEQYPGQVLTTLRDGKTITESYEDGLLHGSRSETYPHSQTIQTLEQYERGKLVKRTSYTIRGVPAKEEAFKSSTHVIVTSWYPKGTPHSREELKEDVLVSGQYFNLANETDSRIESGTGEKTVRNPNGDILSKEVYNNYALTYVETYYPNNTPSSCTSYQDGLIHGEKKEFAMSGEPTSVENYIYGKKHGLCTYYQNGYKFLEVPYSHGYKEGCERHYIDGQTVVLESNYHNGLKHGPTIVYCDGSARTSWYFENQKVARSKFETLAERHDLIMSLQK